MVSGAAPDRQLALCHFVFLSDLIVPLPLPAVLAATDDVVHPLLFACETKNLRIAQISLAALQRLIQYKAVPQVTHVHALEDAVHINDSC